MLNVEELSELVKFLPVMSPSMTITARVAGLKAKPGLEGVRR